MHASALNESLVETNGTQLNVAVAGRGPALLLMHGFPHTWCVWAEIIPVLARTHRVIAPDLRGLGASRREASGYDARGIALDMAGLLDALGESNAAVVAIDAGASPAFLLGIEHPARVSRLVLMEAMIGSLPAPSDFTAGGAPWWFGFHTVPGLAETVLEGHEDDYLDFFLTSGTYQHNGITAEMRDAFVAAYRGRESLRCGFEYYRAMPTSARQIAESVHNARLTIPTMTIGANTVGDTTYRQLQGVTDDLVGQVIPTSGHIIPADRPNELLGLLTPFLDGA